MKIVRRTLAIENIDAMVKFYNGVFGCGLTPVGAGVFVGSLLGAPLVACDASIAGVVAEQSRLQLEVQVDDPTALAARAREFGGGIREEVNGFTIVDPDGNTWVVHAS